MLRNPAQVRFLQAVREASNPLSRPVHGLEMFARDGSWHTAELASFCDTFRCWEIDGSYLDDLRRNIPAAEIRRVDSIRYAKSCRERFGLISIDSPQGTYGSYCEHFEALPAAIGLIGETCVLTFDVNTFPYVDLRKRIGNCGGLPNYEDWFARRKAFYGRPASKLSIEFAQRFYRAYFAERGAIADLFESFFLPSLVADHPDFIARCVVRVSRRRT